MRVGALDEIPDGAGRAFVIDGIKIAVFRTGAKVRAIGDVCTHLGASLAEGRLFGENVACPWHGAQFSLDTGEPVLGPPARGGTGCYVCHVDDDGVWVEI